MAEVGLKQNCLSPKFLQFRATSATLAWGKTEDICLIWNTLFAHVVIYVGPQETSNGKQIHEVVHVAKANMSGLVVARITKVDITKVISARDMVFLGHKVKSCQSAGNLREKIVERANACAEKPNIRFAYDHR